MLAITPALSLADDELIERFVRASGPGGQNVNKVATAVELRFDVAHSPSLPEDLRTRLLARRDRRLTDDGVLVISAHASAPRNAIVMTPARAWSESSRRRCMCRRNGSPPGRPRVRRSVD
jgi:protein subunit release factor B